MEPDIKDMISNTQGDPAVLMIAGDAQMRGGVSARLEREGIRTRSCANLRKALALADRDCRVVLLEDSLPGESSIANVQALNQHLDQPELILLTDQTTRLATIEMLGTRLKAHLSKPLDMDALIHTVKDALGGKNPDQAAGVAPARSRANGARSAIVPLLGETHAMRLVREQVEEVADTDMTVLIRGESGVGKGVVARMVHERSSRRRQNTLATINCPAIPESLMESELFGHEAGAFTGAHTIKPGRIELANGGTAFLDEIAEIPPTMQVKLLQVIENKDLYHLGGKRPIHVDVRFIAATNADLEPMISSGRFRADLYYRINEFNILIPALRDRIEDIPLLAEHFLAVFGEKLRRRPPRLDPDTIAAMMQYHWPGNVRELEMVIHRFVLSGREQSVLHAIGQRQPSLDGRGLPSQSLLHKKEVQMILAVLLQARWNQRKAAKVLGISYSALRRRIAKFGLKNHPSFNVRPGDDDESLELTISTRM